MLNKYGRTGNLTGNVLTAAYLLGQERTQSVVDSLAITLRKMDYGEWCEFKNYIQTGSFIGPLAGTK
jgi:hypothetical protein